MITMISRDKKWCSFMPSVKALVMMVTQTSCLCFLLVVLLNTLLVVETESSQKVTQTGDILLGGIFPVHQKGKGTKNRCGMINKDRGVQRLEAMLFAIDKINADTRLLPDVKLGAIILDTCSSDSYALNQSLEFIRASINTVEGSAFQCTDGSIPRPKYGMKIISGVVGGSYSEVSLQVANLLRLFRIPQVSYASTGTSLSDKSRYDFFARTVPPDTFQALALVDVVQSFNWSYVSIVSSEGQYGDSGMKAFIFEARNRNICIAVNEKVPHSASSQQFDDIFAHLLQKPNARAVVLFVRMEDARGILLAAQRAENINFFTWVASDGWGKEEKLVEGVEEVAEGAITVELQTTIIKEFDTYMNNLNPSNNKRNPWFNEYWEQLFSCKLPSSSSSSTSSLFHSSQSDLSSTSSSSSSGVRLRQSGVGSRSSINMMVTNKRRPGGSNTSQVSSTSSSESLFEDDDDERRSFLLGQSSLPACKAHYKIDESIGYSQETKVQFVVDAVYAFAEALHAAWLDLCRGKQRVCKELKEMDGGLFYQKYLLKVNFTDIVGSQVRFDSQGDGLGRYNIYNYQRTIDPDATTSSSYDNRTTTTTSSGVSSGGAYMYQIVGRWFEDGLAMDRSKILFNERKQDAPDSICSRPCKLGEIKVVQQGDHCCWICNPCRDQEYVVDEFNCKKCLDGWWPHVNKSGCYQLPEQYLRWESVYAIVPVVTSVVGILLTLFVIHTFIKHLDTPIVKASGRELSFILLGGILFCFLITFVLLAKPSILSCAMQRFGVGTGFSVIYGALLTKTNRISRIFDSARKSAKRPSFISPKSQVIICMIFVMIQVLGTTVWFIVEPPATRHFFPDPNHKSAVILKCKVKDASFLVSLVYNIGLICTCTIYAIKTRKIPENFNESKFIGFTMYTTCIIWLAFIPLFFGTGNNYEIQITTLCVSISLSAYVALFCLFSPKIYIIIFHPDKNVRKLTMNSATYKRALTSSTLATAASNHDAVKLVVTGSGIAAAAAAASGVGILAGESRAGSSSVDRPGDSSRDRSDSIKSSGQHRQSSVTSKESDETSNLLLKPPTTLSLKSSHLQDQSKGSFAEVSSSGLQTGYGSKHPTTVQSTTSSGHKVVEVKVFHEKTSVTGTREGEPSCKDKKTRPSSLKRISNGSNRVSSSVSCAAMHERDITASGAPSSSESSYQHHLQRRQSPSSSTAGHHHVSHQRRVTISENLMTDFDNTQEEDTPNLEIKKLTKSMKSSSSQPSSLSLRQRKGESISREVSREEGSSKTSSSSSGAEATAGSSHRSSFDSQRRSGVTAGGADTDSLPDVDQEDLDMDSRL